MNRIKIFAVAVVVFGALMLPTTGQAAGMTCTNPDGLVGPGAPTDMVSYTCSESDSSGPTSLNWSDSLTFDKWNKSGGLNRSGFTLVLDQVDLSENITSSILQSSATYAGSISKTAAFTYHTTFNGSITVEDDVSTNLSVSSDHGTTKLGPCVYGGGTNAVPAGTSTAAANGCTNANSDGTTSPSGGGLLPGASVSYGGFADTGSDAVTFMPVETGFDFYKSVGVDNSFVADLSASNTTSNSSSGVWTVTHNGGSDGTATISSGVVYTFHYEAVAVTPEPSSLLLVMLGMVMIGLYIVRRRKDARQ